MIRPAKFHDIMRISELLREMHAGSKYADRVAISEKTLREVLMHIVSSQNRQGPQATMMSVAVHDGRIEGFIAGQLDRVYHIGNKLTAQDLYLYVGAGGRAQDALLLVDSYIEWATSNPKVVEIMLSWADTLPGAERVAKIYQRKGFHKVGEIWERPVDRAPLEIAA